MLDHQKYTLSYLLTCNAKFDAASTTKDAETLKSDIITKLTNYNTSTLQKFELQLYDSWFWDNSPMQ